MNKLIVTPIALSLLAIMLTGCGEGEDGIFGAGGGSSNEFTVSSFDNSYDNQASGLAIARINQTFSKGENKIVPINIIRNYSNSRLNNLDQTVLVNSYEGTLEKRNIEVNGRTVKRPIYLKNSNTKLNYNTTYDTVSLSGLKANSYNPGNNTTKSTGIRTDLNNYSDIPANMAFPEGSICYIPVINSDREFLAFNAKNETNYRSLNDWVDAAENRFNDNRASSIKRFGVGVNNQQKVAQVKFFAINNEPEYNYNGVEYGNRIYETDYVASGNTTPNKNQSNGVVDCTLVNNVAADFLEAQIREYY